MLTEAEDLHERLPTCPPSRFSVDTGILASHSITAYPASSYIWLADYQEAERYARAALAVYESAAPADRSLVREAIAHIDLSIALVHLGSLDEAFAHGRQALSLASMVDSVLSRASELDRALMTNFPKKPPRRVP